jgi:hypothetical protein
MPHPLYPNARGDCYACSIAITAPGQVKCAAHGTGYLDTVRTNPSTPMITPALIPSETAYVIGGGTVTALAGGPLSLAELGPRTTKRASCLEFNPHTNAWEVLDPVTRRVLHRDADYGSALRWETTHFNRRLKKGGLV